MSDNQKRFDVAPVQPSQVRTTGQNSDTPSGPSNRRGTESFHKNVKGAIYPETELNKAASMLDVRVKDYSTRGQLGFDPNRPAYVTLETRDGDVRIRRAWKLRPDGTLFEVQTDNDAPRYNNKIDVEIGKWEFIPATEQASYERVIGEFFLANEDGSNGRQLKRSEVIPIRTGETDVRWIYKDKLFRTRQVNYVKNTFIETGNVVSYNDKRYAYRHFVGTIVVHTEDGDEQFYVNNNDPKKLELARDSYMKRVPKWVELTPEERRRPAALQPAPQPKPIAEAYIFNPEFAITGKENEAYFVAEDKWITSGTELDTTSNEAINEDVDIDLNHLEDIQN